MLAIPSCAIHGHASNRLPALFLPELLAQHWVKLHILNVRNRGSCNNKGKIDI